MDQPQITQPEHPSTAPRATRSFASVRTPPVFGGPWWPIGLQRYREDPLRALTQASLRCGTVAKLNIGPVDVYLLSDPEHVQRVMQDYNHGYTKQTRGYAALRIFLGNGLVTSEGDFWRRQRRIAQPAFHRRKIAGLATTMVDLTAELLDRWRQVAQAGGTVDVSQQMADLTMRIASQTLLSTEVRDADGDLGHAVTQLSAYAARRMVNPLPLPLWVPTPAHRAYRQLSRRLDRLVFDIIGRRRRTGEDRGDLLSMFMLAKDEQTGERMTDQQLRDEVMTMFVAGHETTSNALTWTLYLLSRHPEARTQVVAELDRVLGGRKPSVDDLPQLTYTRQVLLESMRLFPPVWSIGRRCEQGDMVDGYRLNPQSLVIVSPWVIHRHPDIWPNPEGFDPDRFAEPLVRSRPRYAYFPFGGGPRQCIGNNFALMEGQLILATVLGKVLPDLVPGHPVKPEPHITLRTRHGMRMQLRLRPA